MRTYFYLLLLCLLLFACKPAKTTDVDTSYTSDTLEVHQLADHVYQHVSFLQTQSFGRVACNGMVVVAGKEAIIFDTPTNDTVSLELIQWVEQKLGSKVKAIVPTHFHGDCLGGLGAFHARGIPSYANKLTAELAAANNSPVSTNTFEGQLAFAVGGKKVMVSYLGEGHTRDNVIGYFPEEKVLFGGCLIKETGASKGYLGDANTSDWPLTVAKLKAAYPDASLIIPGHGKAGGQELLDYTITLFESE